MKQSTNSPINHHPIQWVEMCSPELYPCWSRISRVLATVDEPEQADLINRLQSGQPLVYEDTRCINLRYKPMSKTDQQRLAHLLAFEQNEFRLSTFRDDMALYNNGTREEYYSMREMFERGFMPLPTVIVDPLNEVITTPDGHVVDVFIPVRQGLFNFTYHASRHCE